MSEPKPTLLKITIIFIIIYFYDLLNLQIDINC